VTYELLNALFLVGDADVAIIGDCDADGASVMRQRRNSASEGPIAT